MGWLLYYYTITYFSYFLFFNTEERTYFSYLKEPLICDISSMAKHFIKPELLVDLTQVGFAAALGISFPTINQP